MDEQNYTLRSLSALQAQQATSPYTGSLTQGYGQSTTSEAGSTASLLSDFRTMMATMMMSMAQPSFNGSMDGSNGMSGMGGSSMNMSMLMMPLMMSMLERLMALDVNQGQEVSAANSTAIGMPQPVPNGMPIEGGRLTQESHAGHTALDWGIPVGSPVKTTMDGTVVFAGWNDQGYGNLVIVENGPYQTYYAHLSEIPVEVGQNVQHGQIIGLSGNTGNSTGPHLHYEVRKDGVQLDPSDFLTPNPSAYGDSSVLVSNAYPSTASLGANGLPAGYNGSYLWPGSTGYLPLP